MFIDTHCHLEDENFSTDRAEVLERAKVAGVERIINFGSTMQSSIAVAELAKNFSELYAGVGIHPEEIDDFDEKTCTLHRKKLLPALKFWKEWFNVYRYALSP